MTDQHASAADKDSRARTHVVFGAGPVGRALAALLVSNGASVRIVTRTSRSGLKSATESVTADAADRVQAMAACAGADVVYQCAAPPYDKWPELFPALQENILQGAARAGAVLVAVENLYGYGVAGDLVESLPLKAQTRKGKVRAEMSKRLFAAHSQGEVRAVSGRASDFFGPGVRVSAFGERVWPALLKSKPIAWFGDPDLPHTFTYVPDFARALFHLGREPSAWGRAWHAPSPTTRTPRAVFAHAARLAGVSQAKVRPTPKLMMRAVGLFSPPAKELIEIGYSYDEPLRMMHDAFSSAYGLEATDWNKALEATIDWWRSLSLVRAQSASRTSV